MASHSNDSMGDRTIFPTHVDSHTRHSSPPRRRRGISLESTLSGFGGQFDPTRHPYPPHINFSEEDLYAAGSADTRRATDSSTPPPARDAGSGYSTHQGVTPDSQISRMAAYLTTHPYLNESDLEQFRRQHGARQSRSQGTGSSGML